MKKKRLGCLTLSGLMAVFVTLLVVVGVSLAQGGVLYSPGALSARTGAQNLGGVSSHAEIGRKCTRMPHQPARRPENGRPLPGMPHRLAAGPARLP